MACPFEMERAIPDAPRAADFLPFRVQPSAAPIGPECMTARSTRRRRPRRAAVQTSLDFRSWGGPRPGAGRKPRGARAGVPHRPRAPLASRHPLHVTVRLRAGLPSLRRRGAYRVLEPALVARSQRFGFRLVEYSVQTNHVHMLVEAKDRRALARGMQGLLVRLARALNRCWGRCGSVFADRYHDRVLRTPREVRHALAYVLGNARRHGVSVPPGRPDAFSSGEAFHGWRDCLARAVRRLPSPRTWLLALGWRRHGSIPVDEVPGARRGNSRRTEVLRSARGDPGQARTPGPGRSRGKCG